MVAAESRGPCILVTDAGRGSAVAIIRSLGRRGYRVVAGDSDPHSLGFRSRYTSSSFVYPPPERDSDKYCARLLQVVGQQRVDLVIPVTDPALQPLAARRAEFEALTRLAIPANEALGVASDKLETLALAARLGVPVPETRLVTTAEEAIQVAPDLGWPLVLKPQASHRMLDGSGIHSFQVTYAASAEELRREMQRFEGRCGVLLQRYQHGDGHGVELLASRGRPLAAFQHRRLREVPVSGGASSYRESVALDPRLYADSVRLLQELRWDGLAMVEFKVGAEGHQLMEINGRVWGSLPLAVAAGVDFPALLVQLHLRGAQTITAATQGGYRTGLRCRDLRRDFVWVGAVLAQRRRYPFLPMPPRRRALQALLGLLDPRRKLDMMSWDDPLPGLMELPRIAANLWGKRREDS